MKFINVLARVKPRITTSEEVELGGLEANRVENAVRVAIADAPASCLLNSAGE